MRKGGSNPPILPLLAYKKFTSTFNASLVPPTRITHKHKHTHTHTHTHPNALYLEKSLILHLFGHSYYLVNHTFVRVANILSAGEK